MAMFRKPDTYRPIVRLKSCREHKVEIVETLHLDTKSGDFVIVTEHENAFSGAAPSFSEERLSEAAVRARVAHNPDWLSAVEAALRRIRSA